MKRNFLIVSYNKNLDKFTYNYLENLKNEDIKELKKNFKKNGLTIKYIYKIKEIKGV